MLLITLFPSDDFLPTSPKPKVRKVYRNKKKNTPCVDRLQENIDEEPVTPSIQGEIDLPLEPPSTSFQLSHPGFASSPTTSAELPTSVSTTTKSAQAQLVAGQHIEARRNPELSPFFASGTSLIGTTDHCHIFYVISFVFKHFFPT